MANYKLFGIIGLLVLCITGIALIILFYNTYGWSKHPDDVSLRR